MTIQRYEVFNKVVQLQSITKAGNELNLTQSGVSHAVKSLEDELGLNLLIRNRGGVKLTREGEKVYQHTLNIMNEYNNLNQEASALKGIETGEIKVGTFSSITMYWLPLIIKQFKTEYPNININVIEDEHETVEKYVESGELDCCFTIASNEKNIEFIPLKKDKLLCIVSTENPLSKQDTINLEQLEHYPLIRSRKDWFYEVNELLSQYKINLTVKYEISSDHSMIALVKENLGINIRPELVLTNAPPGIRAIEFDKDIYRIIGLGINNRPSHATKRFISTVTDLYQTI
ncbi:LysR family transcriptional regulator [Oceanobacillus jeddahense]|uniref:LysR family transcriptional regulator n=1 Tax=Oceanobacillus jeddahense TaxID=1462527 RepID=UPI003633F4EE